MKLIASNLYFVLASVLVSSCLSSKILVLMPMCSKSHKNCMDPLIEELAKRGHEITEVTIFKTSRPHANIRSIFLEKSRIFFDNITTIASNMSTDGNLKMMTKMPEYQEQIATHLMNDGVFRAFLDNPGHYDVVLTSSIMNDVPLTLIQVIAPGVPIVLLSPSSLFPYIAWELDIPHPSSYIPVQLVPFHSEMTFIQRVINVLATGGFHLLMSCIVSPAAYRSIKSYYPNAKLADARDVERNASLILINSHFTLGGSKPLMPYAVEVGGMHCRPAEKLPEEFSKFVDGGGDNGFIVFSLGSIIQAKYMPQIIIESFKAAFKEISPVRVIWKYEGSLEGLSSNVMVSKWIPQQDLIGHPKCRLAITHGGLLSLQEANYHGVPVLGVPLGGDRDSNLLIAVNKGLAKTLVWDKLTPAIALEALKSMIYNSSYKQTAEKFGRLMRDRPQSPVDTAAYWVEYVIRHEGAGHLRSAAGHLNIFQYFLIDVFAFISLIVIAFLCLCYFTCRVCFRKIFSKNRKSISKNRKSISKNRKSKSD